MEGEFDGPVEIDFKIDVACVAVNLRFDSCQGGTFSLGAATEWTQQMPLELKEADAGGYEESLENGFARQAPNVGQLIGTQLAGCQLVGVFDQVDQLISQLSVDPFAKDVLVCSQQTLAATGGEFHGASTPRTQP
jgi:hypothetical protein